MVVLDTDFLIGVLMGNEAAISKLQHLITKKELLCTTTINSYELYKGAYLSSNPDKTESEVNKLIESLSVLPFDLKSSNINVKIHSSLKINGKPAGIMDQMIGAIVLSINDMLLTRNVKDYKDIEGLKIETW